MNENLKLIEEALNLATQNGAFNLADTAVILSALNGLKSDLEPNPTKKE